jgi:predicted dithiol-disulfide oxidoreductase (DUF899 family)
MEKGLPMTEPHAIVSRDEWIAARRQLLAREKEFTLLRDQLSAQRRSLPWVRVDENYTFRGATGEQTLAQLFAGRSQLVIYHFMFGPEWDAGCKSCSFWADNFNGITAHLAARDVTLVAISRAPLAKLQAFAERLGWSFPWFSSHGSDFNFDYQVSLRPEDFAAGKGSYNYAPVTSQFEERPGVSVFYKDASGAVFHTYSCYARGLDMLNVAYQYLDLVPKGRDEAGLPYPMAWVRYRDQYGR